jgi:nicotinamidase-related amidase
MIELHQQGKSIYFSARQIAVVYASKVTHVFVAGITDDFGVDETAKQVVDMILEEIYRETHD